jgi:hypothetical protein
MKRMALTFICLFIALQVLTTLSCSMTVSQKEMIGLKKEALSKLPKGWTATIERAHQVGGYMKIMTKDSVEYEYKGNIVRAPVVIGLGFTPRIDAASICDKLLAEKELISKMDSIYNLIYPGKTPKRYIETLEDTTNLIKIYNSLVGEVWVNENGLQRYYTAHFTVNLNPSLDVISHNKTLKAEFYQAYDVITSQLGQYTISDCGKE